MHSIEEGAGGEQRAQTHLVVEAKTVDPVERRCGISMRLPESE